jgi:hypothetical protein
MPARRTPSPRFRHILIPEQRPVLPSVDNIPEARRRAVFAALAKAKAAGLSTDAALFAVAKEHVLTVLKVEAIEQEGLAHGWNTGG